ncbi:MAG: hypothetical protein FWF99_00815, partial [Desulfovibrionaceae bacterium]|nr:hypothetical protein [Desulfovibrionaceae bacterium]
MIKQLKILFPAILFSLAFPSQALAYLDPGTGSMLVSALVGLAATLFFLLKSSWYKLLSLSYRLLGQSPPQSPGGLVFYSEGRQYWTTFQPVLEELEARGEAVLYLSSDEQDPGLRRAWRHISTRCLGMGNRGFAA